MLWIFEIEECFCAYPVLIKDRDSIDLEYQYNKCNFFSLSSSYWQVFINFCIFNIQLKK